MYSLTFIFNLSFNYKEWGKTTTKTEEVVPEAGRVPGANRATGAPVNEEPSAPTTNPTNPFKFHFLTFLLITKNGGKQQRKPRS